MSWNASTAWEAKVKAITWRLDDQQPRFRHEQWKLVFEKQLSSTPFTIQAADPLFSLPLGEEAVKFTYWMSKDAIWKRYSTLSQIAVLSPAEKEVSTPQNRNVVPAPYRHSNFALAYQTSYEWCLTPNAGLPRLISVAGCQKGGFRGYRRRRC